jgi:phage protein U
MLIGSWGPLIFQVSGIGALTFSEITQDSSGRWAIHEPINTAPVTEFLGPGQDEADIKMVLTRMLGIDPAIHMELLRQLVRKGKNFPLILRGMPLSGNMWYVDKISGVSSYFAAGTGDILWTAVSCQFREYR